LVKGKRNSEEGSGGSKETTGDLSWDRKNLTVATRKMKKLHEVLEGKGGGSPRRGGMEDVEFIIGENHHLLRKHRHG